MPKSLARGVAAALVLVACALAQPPRQTVYFSSRFTEAPASGRAGDINSITAPCGFPNTPAPLGTYGLESAIANSPGVSYVEPGVPNSFVPFSSPVQSITDYVEVFNFPQMNLAIGDLDGDSLFEETGNFAGVDAIYIPSALIASGRPNTMHEMFISTFQDSIGMQGFINASITEADMVLIPRAPNVYPLPSTPGTLIYFIRQSQWETLFNLPGVQNTIDLDAFAVDEATGDLYASFDGLAAANANAVTSAQVRTSAGGPLSTVTLVRGDVIRIPRAAYTPAGPYGIVTAPLGGLAERILSATDVQAMVAAAGGTFSVSPVNVFSLDLDPAGGVFAHPSNGFVMPNLLFTVESSGGAATGTQNLSAAAIYSTAGGGSYAVINGVTMDRPNAMGMRNLSFNPGFFAGVADGLDVVTHTPSFDPLNSRPLHLDTFPTSGIISNGGTSPTTWNVNLTGYISGAQPGALLGVFGGVFYPAPGTWVPRWDVSVYGVGGYPDLYIDPFGLASPLCLISPPIPPFDQSCQTGLNVLLTANPMFPWTDPVNGQQNGDACFTVNLNLVLPFGTLPYSPPPLLVFQVLDFASIRLSSPLAFQLN